MVQSMQILGRMMRDLSADAGAVICADNDEGETRPRM